MAERMREVVGKHSTWYVCDEHGWDFTNVDEDVCPVCYGESLAEKRIIKLAQDKYNYLIETFGIAIVKDQLDLLLELMDAIKGEK